MGAMLLSPAAAGTGLTGRAAEAVAELGDRAVLCDLYDEAGAPVYHDIAGTTPHEVRELLSTLRRIPGPVLDLAAGSGRLTFPFLALGREVTALELSGHMIGLLRDRLAATPASLQGRCTPVQADMSDFSLGRRFGAVVLGTTSISLLPPEARPGLYRCVREHLAPGGRFLLTTVEVDAADDGSDESEILAPGEITGRSYRMIEQWTSGNSSRTVTVIPADPPAEGPVHVATTTIGVMPAPLLVAELEAAGFAIRSTTPIPGGGRHHDVLLEAEAL
ncbi:daptide-type RiPP biosynthesis methyltransferase [Streptomyces sp. NBC_01244]|uniref:daptide-type RiPP biosynthesis methyltransferase n=1 Tax=Streptomyces sp. NBC_01244 TaxID=2903797 RepID=UPI002E12B855|nr:class I SAM-dependent methyltransferase [Streptomyces sp. NBC_01244]